MEINKVMTNMTNFQGTFNLTKSGFDPKMPGHHTDHTMILRQPPRTAKQIGAGISLPYEVRLEIGLMLDDHQCALNVALHQYNKHHWMSEGAEGFISIHHLLEEHIEQTQKHIDMIGERVARLGVVPTAHPVTQHDLSYIKHEAEGRYSLRDFLRNDLEHELKLQQMMRQTIARAHELHDFGTVQVLEEVLVDREDLGYHLYSVLEDDTLVRGMEHLLSGEGNIAGDRPMDPGSKLQ
ncbi:MAG: ferritin Dps family protein [Firmicutes bacterium]|nr:ferritin Dps family protein [Bacillota bacterium]